MMQRDFSCLGLSVRWSEWLPCRLYPQHQEPACNMHAHQTNISGGGKTIHVVCKYLPRRMPIAQPHSVSQLIRGYFIYLTIFLLGVYLIGMLNLWIVRENTFKTGFQTSFSPPPSLFRVEVNLVDSHTSFYKNCFPRFKTKITSFWIWTRQIVLS